MIKECDSNVNSEDLLECIQSRALAIIKKTLKLAPKDPQECLFGVFKKICLLTENSFISYSAYN